MGDPLHELHELRANNGRILGHLWPFFSARGLGLCAAVKWHFVCKKIPIFNMGYRYKTITQINPLFVYIYIRIKSRIFFASEMPFQGNRMP